MFSDFAKFIAQPARHAEKAGTRSPVHRHGPDYKRKKKTKQDELLNHNTDQTEISIDAAILFLSDLANRNTPKEIPQAEHAKTRLKILSKPAAIQASYAYEHAAETSTPTPGNAKTLKHENITDLIARLKILKSQNIEILHIKTDGDFLQSLSNAADRALTTT